MISLIVSATSVRTSWRSQPLVTLQDRLADLVQFLVVGAEAHEENLAEDAPDQGATVQQPAGVELRTERDERRLGDDGLIQVEEGGSHVVNARSLYSSEILAVALRR
jgi:hypothetical protein